MLLPVPRLAAILLTVLMTVTVVYGSLDSHPPVKRDSTPITRRMTNAERLSRGLPPNKPITRPRAMKARGGSSATLTSSSVTTSPTPACPGVVTGNLEWSGGYGFMDDGTEGDLDYPQFEPGLPLQYIKSTQIVANYGLFSIDTCATGPICIQCLNCPQATESGWSCLGIAESINESEGGDFCSNCSGFLSLTTPAPNNITTPQFGESLYSSDEPEPYEASVWLYDYTTNVLSLQWTNPNGSTIPVKTYGGAPYPGLWLTPWVFTDGSTSSKIIEFDLFPLTFTFIPVV